MKKVAFVPAAALLVASDLACATPAHYVVFEVDAANVVTPMFYRRVDIATETTQRIRDDAKRQDDALDYRVLRNGTAVATRHVVIEGLRAEFANDPEHGDNRIVAHDVHPDKRYFTLRVPVADGDALEFGEGASMQRLSLASIAAKASTLTYADSAPLQIERQVNAGNSANRVDILVLGDGYTASEESLFDADAQILHDSFFSLTPYKEYRNFVNWTTGFVASNQSGATHPPYQANCTQEGVCCSDTEAQSDPRAGTTVDNHFGARFCSYQVHRLVTINYATLMAAASAYPDWDEVMVVVNDPVYGGAGGPYSLTTTEQSADQIVLHEYGHSFSRLADEYSYAGATGTPSCHDGSGNTPCAANVTDVSNAALVKWRSWFTPGIAIPTPSGTAGVGLFEGADYLPTGMYRAKDYQCLMNYLGMPFCPVCTQEYVLSMYRGGWGAPSGGVDLIEPGSESPLPGSAEISYASGSLMPFDVTTLQPADGAIGIQWYWDGNPIAAATTAHYDLQRSVAQGELHTLEIHVTDLTTLVAPSMAEGLLMHQRTWQVRGAADLIFENGFDS